MPTWNITSLKASLLLIAAIGSTPSHAASYVISSNSTAQNGGHSLSNGDTLTLNAGVTLNAADAIDDASANTLTINVYGTVTGNDAIQLDTDDNSLNMYSGSSATNTSDDGVDIGGDNNTVTIHSGATVTGKDEGIGVGGNNNTFTIYGDVITTGTTDDDALDIEGSGNTVHIHGTIKTAGATSCTSGATECNAIEADEGNTIYLHKGATIVGGIQSSDGTTLANKLYLDLGSSQSYNYTLNVKNTGQAWQVADQNGRSVSSSSTSAVAAGVGNIETADEVLYSRSKTLTDSINRYTGSDEFWFDAYSSSADRQASGQTINKFDMDTTGVTLIKPFSDSDSSLVIGIQNGSIDITGGVQRVKSNTTTAGLVKQYGNTRSRALISYSKNKSEQIVLDNTSATGKTTYKADYSAVGVSLGLGGKLHQSATENNRFSLSYDLDISHERIDDYTENNTFKWKARNITQAVLATQAVWAHQIDNNLLQVTGGIAYRALLSGKTASYDINTTSASFTDANSNEAIYSLGFLARHEFDDGSYARLNVEATESNKDASALSVALSVGSAF